MWAHPVKLFLLFSLYCQSCTLGSTASPALPLDMKAAPWRRGESAHLSRLNRLQLEQGKLGDVLGSVLDYEFSLPETQLRKGSAYTGNNHRLRRVVHDLMTGERPVRVGVVGGSISWGHGASIRGITDWFSVVSEYLKKAFPKAQITTRNGCIPGTPSMYMIMCLELSVDWEVDLVFVEYLLNDGFDPDVANNNKVRTAERLYRRILSLPHHPALVPMQVLAHGQSFDRSNHEWLPFFRSMEDLYGALSQYYDLQWLSLRTALYRIAGSTFNLTGQRMMDYMVEDGLHPNDRGNKAMADLAVWLLQQTALDLMLRPFDEVDSALVVEPLPLPMVPGNLEPSSSMCLHQDAFQQVVISHDGWEYVNEGTAQKPKKGYVARKPGSVLKLKVDTSRDNDQSTINVMLAYLKSWDGMGIATIRCVEGCGCKEKQVNALNPEHESQVYLATFEVSQSKNCIMSVTVEDKTQSNGHKFKISGVMMTEKDKTLGTTFGLRDGDSWGMGQYQSGQR